jgi:LEA14-like dessication related protein
MKYIPLLFLGLVINSCQILQEKLSTYAPDIFFKNANIKAIDMSGVNLNFLFSAKNKAPIPINFSSIQSQILVDGKKLLNASIPQGLQLKANGTSDFSVDQRIEFKDVTKDLLDLFKKDSLKVSVDGLAKFAMGQFGNADVPIKASHVVPVPKVPEIQFEKFEYVKTEASILDPKALFELKFKVMNPNAFGLDLNSIKYSFNAENLSLVDGTAAALNLSSKEQKSYSIPVTLKGRDMINMVPKLRNFSSLKYKFAGNMNLKAGALPLDVPFTYP